MIEKHPVTVRLYSIGVPTWVGFAIGGPPIAVVLGVLAVLVVLVGWE